MDKKKNFFHINKILINILLFSLIALGSVLAEQAKPVFVPEVKAHADKTTINIGDIINYDIIIQIPAAAELKFPAEKENKTLGPFEIRGLKQEKANPAADVLQIIRKYELTVFKVGEQIIPEYSIEYRLPDNADWQKITAPSIKIVVESVLEKEAEQLISKPLKPKLIIWRDFWGWFIGLAIFTLLGIIIFLVKKYMIKLKTQPEVIIPAHLITLEELKQLQALDLITKGMIELFFEKLSGCLRRYLENRFHLRAPWMSTEEFLSKAKTSSLLTTEHKHLLQDFLVFCDMVKFARYESSASEANDSFAIVRNFVEQTKLVETDNNQEVKQ